MSLRHPASSAQVDRLAHGSVTQEREELASECWLRSGFARKYARSPSGIGCGWKKGLKKAQIKVSGVSDSAWPDSSLPLVFFRPTDERQRWQPLLYLGEIACVSAEKTNRSRPEVSRRVRSGRLISLSLIGVGQASFRHLQKRSERIQPVCQNITHVVGDRDGRSRWVFPENFDAIDIAGGSVIRFRPERGPSAAANAVSVGL